MAFMTEPGRDELRRAIAAIEEVSSVEVVVAVRPRLRRWPSAHAAIGVSLAIAALAFALFAEAEFELYEILLLPVLAGMIGGLAVELVPPLQRALTPRRARARELREGSRATFYELGVHKTRGRTGVLVYIVPRDRVAALVGDAAVVDKLGQPALDRIGAALAAEIPNGVGAVARTLRDTAKRFGDALPHAADDIDELPNEVHMLRPRSRARVGS